MRAIVTLVQKKMMLVKVEIKKPHSIFHYYVGKILDEDNEEN